MIKKITILKIVVVAMIWAGFVVKTVSSNQEIIHEDGSDMLRGYQKATEQGDADAQSMLGWMSYSGEGVPQDYMKAFEWLEKAAKQGHADA